MGGWCKKCFQAVENTLIACPNCGGENFSFTDLNNAITKESDQDLEVSASGISESAVKTGFFRRSSDHSVEKDEKREAAQKQKELEKFSRSPVGRAKAALDNGGGFFEIELEVGSSDRQVFFGTADYGSHTKNDFTGLLSEIERVGWRLEHVGYYFMITGESSRDKFLASGQSVAVSGKTMGVYLFRNAKNPTS